MSRTASSADTWLMEKRMALMTPRRDRIATAVVASLLVGSLVIAAVREDGYKADNVTLHENGVWVTRPGEFGRVNMDLYRVDLKDGRFSVDDVLQSDGTVVVKTAGDMVGYNQALGEMIGNPVPLPDGGEIGIAAGTGALLDPGSGRFWLTAKDSLVAVKSTDTTDLTPGYYELPGASEMVLGADGRAYVIDVSNSLVWHLDRESVGAAAPVEGATGSTTTTTGPRPSTATDDVLSAPDPVNLAMPLPEHGLQATAVGTTVVFIIGSMLTFEDGRTVDLAALGSGLTLQQPGLDGGSVVVASNTGLFRVDVASGTATPIHEVDPGVPVRPVVMNGCVYGAWTTGVYSSCSHPTSRNDVRPPEGSRFRTNRQQAVLNFPDGRLLLFPADVDMQTVDTWANAVDPSADDTEDTEIELTDDIDPCEQAPVRNTRPTVPDGAEFTVRSGQAVRLDVLNPRGNAAAASDAECDVLTVALPDELPSSLREQLAVIEDGRALQFTASGEGTGPVSVRYSISDGSAEGTVERSAVVHIIPRDDVGRPPEPEDDRATAEVGQTVVIDVLANDWDPDGDMLQVQSFDAPEDGGRVVWQPGGRVAYTAPAIGAGLTSLRYSVIDATGLSGEAVLEVELLPLGVNKPPKARPDAVLGMMAPPGQPSRVFTVNVLDNDSDPNGDALQLVSVSGYLATAAVPAPERSTDGTVRFTPPAGLAERTAFNFTYTVSDGHDVAIERVRFDILPYRADESPVAVSDSAVVSATQPTVIDVLANDFDLNGDVLMIDRVETSPDTGNSFDVEILDHRVLRLTATSSPDPMRDYQLDYVITDGIGVSAASLMFRVNTAAAPQQPITTEDHADVHLGGYLSIPVLANDFDPNGNALEVLSTKLDDKVAANGAPGFVFVQNNEVRYVPPSPDERPGPFTATGEYVITNGRDTATGRFVIQVRTLDENRSPSPEPIELRVPGGNSAVLTHPSYGLDPDGDLVVLVGEETSPALGTVEAINGNTALRYTPLDRLHGSDTFRWRLRDSLGAIGVLEVRVVVSPAATGNRPPVAVRDVAEVAVGRTTLIPLLLNDTDPDGDVIQFDPGRALDPPTAGDVQLDAGLPAFVSYTAPVDVGEYAFNYYITDGSSAPVRGLVQVRVLPPDEVPNQPPIVRDVRVDATAAGDIIEIPLKEYAIDPEGTVLDFAVGLDAPAGAIVDLSDPTNPLLTFTMGREPLVFTFIADDREPGGRSYGAVLVPTPSNRGPVAELQVFEVGPDMVGPILIPIDRSLWTDPDGDEMDIYRAAAPSVSPGDVNAGGDLSFEGDAILLNRRAEFSGEALVTYYIFDQPPATDEAVYVPARILLKVTSPINHPPSVIDEPLDLYSGTSVTFDLGRIVTDEDPGDQANVTFGLDGWEGPAGVDVALTGRTLRLTADDLAVLPAAGAEDGTVTFTVSDGKPDGTVTGTLSVHVLPENAPLPQAVDDAPAAVDQGKVVVWNLTANDPPNSDVPYQIVQVSEFGPDSHPLGTIEIVGAGSVRFTPTPGESGSSSFVYTIADKWEREATATVRFSVRAAPDAPGRPTVGEQLSRTAVVTFGLPVDNGAPIDRFEVHSAAGSTECAGSPCTVEGLTNGAAYVFTVRAHNEVGWSDWSPPSAEYVPDEYPGQPPSPSLTWDDASVRVTWGALPNEGSAITNVAVTANPGGLQQNYTGGGSGGFVDFVGLKNGTLYTFSLVSTNGKGESVASPGASTTPIGPPQWGGIKPTLTAWNGFVDVSWTAADGNGDNGVTYTVELLHNGVLVASKSAGTATAVSIPAPNGVVYTARVIAENAWTVKHGQPQVSGESNQDKGEAPPGPPPSFSVVAGAGTGVVNLSWGAADNGGGTISTYQVAFSTNSNSFTNWLSVGTGTSTSLGTTNGLTLGTAYYFQVRALNDNREGVAGTASAAAGPGAPYTQPNLEASCSNTGNTISCSWSVKSWNGPAGDVDILGDWTANNVASSGSHSFGDVGYSATRTITVTACNGGINGNNCTSLTRFASTPPPPQPTVTIAWGASAQGQPGCTVAACKWVTVSIANFGAGTYSVECWGDFQGWSGWYAASRSLPTNQLCYFGYPGYHVYVRVLVNGTWYQSNTLTN